jgi:hypothetical protein
MSLAPHLRANSGQRGEATEAAGRAKSPLWRIKTILWLEKQDLAFGIDYWNEI